MNLCRSTLESSTAMVRGAAACGAGRQQEWVLGGKHPATVERQQPDSPRPLTELRCKPNGDTEKHVRASEDCVFCWPDSLASAARAPQLDVVLHSIPMGGAAWPTGWPDSDRVPLLSAQREQVWRRG